MLHLINCIFFSIEGFNFSRSGDSGETKLAPTAEQLKNFERDPRVALLACASNSGQGRFLATDQNDLLNGSPIAIKQIKEEIEKNLKKEDFGYIFRKFQSQFDKNAKLVACACCGVRCFEMGGKVMHDCHLEMLAPLLMNKQQVVSFYKLPEIYRKAASVYLAYDGRHYHLHPEFVSQKINDEFVKICNPCRQKLFRSTPAIPKLSLAAGVDFGLVNRLNLPPPTLVEELLLSRSRIFVSLVKLVGPTAAQRQTAKSKSHVITFPAPEGPTKLYELQRLNSSHDRSTYPRLENMKEHLGVFFLGSRLQYEAMIPFHGIQELQVRVEVVYRYLHLFSSVNPLYQDVVIDESDGMKTALESITSELLKETVIMDNEMDLVNDIVASSQVAEESQVEDLPDEQGNITLPSSFLSRVIPADRDPNRSTRAALEGIMFFKMIIKID